MDKNLTVNSVGHQINPQMHMQSIINGAKMVIFKQTCSLREMYKGENLIIEKSDSTRYVRTKL